MMRRNAQAGGYHCGSELGIEESMKRSDVARGKPLAQARRSKYKS